MTLAGLCFQPAPQQDFKLFLLPDKLSQTAGVKSLSSRLNRAAAPPKLSRGDTLEVLRSEVLKLEQIAKQLSCAPR